MRVRPREPMISETLALYQVNALRFKKLGANFCGWNG